MTSPLARPELAPLVDELARRLANGDVPRTITLRSLPVASRRALADLLGLDRLVPADHRLPVHRLNAAIGAACDEELRSTVEDLRGPLPDRRAARAAQREARDALWEWCAAEAATIQLADLTGWVQAQRATGIRGGLDAHRRRLADALAVLRALPADGVPLAALANDCVGDPHALDNGRALTGIVLDALALTAGVPRPTDAELTRTLWEGVGVVPDPLSSTVLALGLPGGPHDPLARWLAASGDASEPVVLTLAQLRRWPRPPLASGTAAYVVENPSLLVDAAARGWSGPPLVCSSGRPTIATVTLLRQLGAGGALLYQHADFDAAGLAITAWLAQRAGTTPWRMTTRDYTTAVCQIGTPATFTGPVPATPWDAGLQRHVQRRRVAVYEEQLRDELLTAMTTSGRVRPTTTGRAGWRYRTG